MRLETLDQTARRIRRPLQQGPVGGRLLAEKALEMAKNAKW